MRIVRSSQRGVALVIVLAFLVLISVFILGFLSSVKTDLRYSKTNADAMSAQRLNDFAVNLVMGQILEATAASSVASGTLWASQPGMIRTFDNTSAVAKKGYKLYSSAQMVVDGSAIDSDISGNSEVPNNWWSADNAAIYTDLNEPVLTEDPNGPITPKDRSTTYSAVYPILDPYAEKQYQGRPLVDGFKFNARPGFVGGNNLPTEDEDPTEESSSGTMNPAPMPVQWMYVLQDGSIKPGKSSGGGAQVDGATRENPIVGRIAFWTDDESAKVNINTASEGVYWDVPRAATDEDVGAGSTTAGASASTPGLALHQPANGEFQRYPGHPATTCLSVVFGTPEMGLISPVPDYRNRYTALQNSTTNTKQLSDYYKIAPRISQQDRTGATNLGSNAGTRVPDKPLAADNDRLYTSIDELMFTPGLLAGEREPTRQATQQKMSNPLARRALERARFFITANSNAPEVTPFNTPKVSMWPVWGGGKVNSRTVFDKLSAFCSSTGVDAGSEKAYYFTRENPRSMTQDFSGRNTVLFDYLKKEMSTNIPGFGGNFKSKYDQDYEQILVSIFDYIRCTNLSDTTDNNDINPNDKAEPFVKAPNFLTHPNLTPGGGEVLPIRIGDKQGFGRFDTVTEFDLILYKDTDSTMRAAVLLQFGGPMQGNIGYQPGLKYRITGLDQLKVNGTPLNLPGDATNYIATSDLQTHHGRGLGGIDGPAMALENNKYMDNNNSKARSYRTGDPGIGARWSSSYPFISSQSISAGTGSFTLSGAEIKIYVMPAESNSDVVQTINISVPSSNLTMPAKATKTFDVRPTRDDAQNQLIESNDIVLGMQIKGSSSANDSQVGDMRMIAARKDVPATLFQKHKNWGLNNKAYGLITALGRRYVGADSGILVTGASYMGGASSSSSERWPGIPSRVTSGVKRSDGGPGDWDTGIGVQKDGAYLNKPDEGDQRYRDMYSTNGNAERIPYIQKDDHGAAMSTNFSPTRQVPSSMMLGSIPTGIWAGKPWQTLLFCAKPDDTTHPGLGTPKDGPPFTSPPDYLVADLFWMPVVEPYAISQPFATAGKINMNYQIQPFTYIQRDTGMRAVLKSTKFQALQVVDASTYKPFIESGSLNKSRWVSGVRRYSIHMDATLNDFAEKFKANGFFRSPSQICEMNLYPATPNSTNPQAKDANSMKSFWSKNLLTGNNLREKPYVDIYPRLTTKSNVFTVHVRVQGLKKGLQTPADTFIDPKSGQAVTDAVVSEYRGSSIIERYIDPNDSSLPDFARDFAANPDDDNLNIDRYYRFRVVSTKRFAP